MATVAEKGTAGRPREKGYCPLGMRIDALMTRKHLDVKGLAAASGVKERTIYAILDGDTEEPKASTLGMIATALGTTREKLSAGLF